MSRIVLAQRPGHAGRYADGGTCTIGGSTGHYNVTMLRVVTPPASLVAGVAHADSHQCVDLHIQFVPADSLQIAAWVEDTGNYKGTVYLAQDRDVRARQPAGHGSTSTTESAAESPR